MGRKGENIFKRKDNRWEARYVKGYKPDGKYSYGFVYGKTYNEVKRKKNELLLNLNVKKKENLHHSFIFNQKIDLWLLNQKHNVKESTFANYNNLINRYIRPHLGKLLLRDIDNDTLINFKDYLLTSARNKRYGGLSPKTTSDVLTLVKQILKYYDISTNVKNPRIVKEKLKIIPKEEQKKLELYIKNNMSTYTFGILLTLYTGIRIGELCALKYSDIDFIKNTISVQRTISRISMRHGRYKTKVIITEPKTHTSIREIPLNSLLMNVFKNKIINGDNYILTGTDKYIEPRNFYTRYKNILKKAQMSDYNFHILRHTFATRCIEIGIDPKSLSEILGHSNVKTTLSLYVHPTLENKKIFLEQLLTN